MTATNTIRRVSNVALIVSFLTVIWLPTWDWLWGLDRRPTLNENRKPAEFPRRFTTPGPYLAAFGSFFEDHFGFRNELVHWNAYWKWSIFNESPDTTTLQGEQGWLYWAKEGMVENYTGQAQFTEKELQNWQKLLEARRDWLARRGGKYIFVVAPNKETIYPEFLPKWVVRSGHAGKLDEFLAYMRQHSTVPVLDLRPDLIAAKSQRPTYYKTDTHWNNFGAFVAYQRLLHALQEQIPELKPLGLDCFDLIPAVGRGGDLAICIGQEYEMPETQGVTFRPLAPLHPLQRLQRLQRFDHDGQNSSIVTQNPAEKGKVILFRDSFSEAWIPFVGYHFNQAIYLGERTWDRAMLEREKPDLVVDEIVERKFNNQAPLELLAMDEKTETNGPLSVQAKINAAPLVGKTGPSQPSAPP
jgi:alginate O-acetyltransferase complex protein AlgJ